MQLRSFHSIATSASRKCRPSVTTRCMEGAHGVKATSMSSCAPRKTAKLSDQHAMPGAYPILNYFLQQMLNARQSLYRSLSRTRVPTQRIISKFPSMVNTRNKNYTYDNVAQEQGNLEVTTEPIDFRRARWAHLLRTQDYKPIVSEVLEEELPKYARSTAINVNNRMAYIAECANILASASPVFASAVEGDLVRRMKTDPSLQQQYALISEAARNQPSIYVYLLADGDGVPPTPNQYLVIRDYVADYIAEGRASKHAWQIDQISHPLLTKQESADDCRKYLETKKYKRWAKRVENLELFCQGVQKRWHETPASLRDTPFRYPPSECGYSACLHDRIVQHRTRQSSNSVMNLVEDICTYLYNTGVFKQHFKMHPYVIYLIFRLEQAAIAEIFCSGLLQVWVKTGGGFNAYHAGRSVDSATKVSAERWASYEVNARLNSPLIANMRMQQLNADEWRQALGLRDESTVEQETRESVSQEEDCFTQFSQLSM